MTWTIPQVLAHSCYEVSPYAIIIIYVCIDNKGGSADTTSSLQEASPGSRGTCTGKDMKACTQARPKLVICTVKRQVTESLAGSTASL